jgi:acyl-coenzyme A synthetase/AMP-(fatty) acid ligase
VSALSFSQRFNMLGRLSTDILKTGGYKVSALEVERALAGCPAVHECAVVGVPDRELGQRIVCVVIPSNTWPKLSHESSDRIRRKVTEWLHERLPKYKVPRTVHVASDFPRNALGKVQKKKILQEWPVSLRP